MAFIVTAWLTILISALNAWYPTKDSIVRFRHWKKERQLVDSDKTPFKWPYRSLPWAEKLTDLYLFSLCDLQLITGTSILIAGFAQWNTITFYHRQLVLDYWFLALNSFWAARAGKYRTVSGGTIPSKWQIVRFTMRNIFVFITLVLATVYNTLQVVSDKRDWDPYSQGQCYRYHDRSAWGSQWLWIVGEALYAVTVAVQFTARGRKRVDFVTESAKKACLKLGQYCVDSWTKCWSLWTRSRGSNLIAVSKLVRDGFLSTTASLLLLLISASVQFCAVWCVSEGFQAIEVTCYIAFAAWNTFDIVDMKFSNAALLVGSESSWGFSQVLPMVLLVSLVFGLLDAIKETFA